MSATMTAAREWTTTYSTPELLGMMTLAMIFALLSISLGFRMVKTMQAVRKYEEACEQVKAIEVKLTEMKDVLLNAEQAYEKSLAEMNQLHTKECFDLQQIVFERNAEILDLKNKLLRFNMNSPV